jgi:hypothetical protein
MHFGSINAIFIIITWFTYILLGENSPNLKGQRWLNLQIRLESTRYSGGSLLGQLAYLQLATLIAAFRYRWILLHWHFGVRYITTRYTNIPLQRHFATDEFFYTDISGFATLQLATQSFRYIGISLTTIVMVLAVIKAFKIYGLYKPNAFEKNV